MNKQTDEKQNKVGAFLKKNIYYILMILAVLAIITMIVVAAVMSSEAKKTPVDGPVISTPVEPDVPEETIKPDNKPVAKVFIIDKPVMTDNLGLNYSEDQLVFHPTQGAWKTHLGVDYIADAGTDVMAVFDGRVKSIETDSYYGTTMVIEHMDGFESVYKLMGKDVKHKIGETVKKGDVIGVVGNASTYEVKTGDHLHFELMKNGELVDPNLYFVGGNK